MIKIIKNGNSEKQFISDIDNANPSEALECLEKVSDYLNNVYDYKEIIEEVRKDINTIKQALIKAEKEHKVLEIIKEKRVDMWHLVDLLEQTYEMYLAFCKSEKYEEDYILTEEEFDLLKEVLE